MCPLGLTNTLLIDDRPQDKKHPPLNYLDKSPGFMCALNFMVQLMVLQHVDFVVSVVPSIDNYYLHVLSSLFSMCAAPCNSLTILNGEVVYTDSSRILGTMAIFNCNQDYDLSEMITLTCTTAGASTVWSPSTVPFCRGEYCAHVYTTGAEEAH